MNGRRIIPVALHVLAGALSLFASILGVGSLFAEVHVAGRALAMMYSIPLLLLLPVYFLSFFKPRISVAIMFLAAFVFACANILIDAHTCGGSHPCASLISIVVKSFFDPMTLIPFVIAALLMVSIHLHQAQPEAVSARRFS